MSDQEDVEPTHCFSHLGNKIYVLIDKDTTEEDLLEALVESMQLKSNPTYYRESKYQTCIDLKFIITHASCLGTDYGELEVILDNNNIDIAAESNIDKLVALSSSSDKRIQNNAMRKLTILARRDDNCAALVKLGIIEKATETLNSPNNDLVTASCGILWNMAYDDNIKVLIGNAGPIPKLVSLLDSSVVTVHRAATGALMNISCDNDKNIGLIETAGGVDPLIKLLESPVLEVKATAATALRNLAARESLRPVIALKGALKSLMSMVSIQNQEVQKGAAGCLAFLAEDPGVRDQISRQDAVSALLPLLMAGSNDDELLASTARAIAKLALDDTNCIEIGNKGGIPVFVKLLNSKSANVLKWVCNALYNLAVHDANSKQIGDTEAIPILVQLLSFKDREVLTHCVGALWNLSARDENTVKIVRAGGLPPLIALLKNQDMDIVRRALPCLGNLARIDSVKKEVVSKGGVNVALSWINSEFSEIRDNSAYILLGVCQVESGANEVAKEKGVSKILKALDHASPSLTKSILQILLLLSGFDKSRESLCVDANISCLASNLTNKPNETILLIIQIISSISFKENLVDHLLPFVNTLLELSKHEDRSIQLDSLTALADMSVNEKASDKIASLGGIPLLVEQLDSDDVPIKTSTCRAIVNVSNQDSNKTEIVSNGALSKLVMLLKTINLETTELALSALQNLASSEECNANFVEEGVVVSFIDILISKDSEQCIESSLLSLVNLSNDDQVSVEIALSDNGLEAISQFLENSSITWQGYSAVILCNIARIPDVREKVDNNTLLNLIKLLKSKDVFSQTHSSAALHYFAQSDSLRPNLISGGIIQPLCAFFDLNDERARNASWTIEQLATNDAPEILKVCGLPKLVNYLKSNNVDVRNASLFTLYKCLRTNMDLKSTFKQSNMLPALSSISSGDDKRASGFSTYMSQVINS